MLRSGFKRIALSEVIGQALEPFQAGGRIAIADGPEVAIGKVASQALTLTFHELATNAAKYGALSNGTGKIAIDWRVETNGGDRRVALSWAESGGPRVAAPERLGQGTHFIEGSVRYELRGSAKLDFARKGLRAEIEFPLRTDDASPLSPIEAE